MHLSMILIYKVAIYYQMSIYNMKKQTDIYMDQRILLLFFTHEQYNASYDNNVITSLDFLNVFNYVLYCNLIHVYYMLLLNIRTKKESVYTYNTVTKILINNTCALA